MATFVTILMPCYNAERYLDEAVRSLLAQTHQEFELLAIDDGSTDRTRSILDSFAALDPRVKVIAHENRGMGRSLNDAMETAAGEWLVRMDADDVMVPQRIERQLAFLAEHPRLVVASTLVQYIDETGTVIGQSKSEFTDPARVTAALERHEVMGFHHPAVVMRKSIIREMGGYRPAFWPCDDADLWNRVVERYPDGVRVQDEYLMQYRIHGGSVCVAQSRLTTQKAEWVHACIRARRSGRPEPTWDEFLAEERRLPWLARLNRGRCDIARTLYKAAVFHYSRRQYARFVPKLIGATVLEPSYVLPRVLPQWGLWAGQKQHP